MANPGYADQSDPSTLTREVADLSEIDRILMMDVQWQFEHMVREVVHARQINLAKHTA